MGEHPFLLKGSAATSSKKPPLTTCRASLSISPWERLALREPSTEGRGPIQDAVCLHHMGRHGGKGALGGTPALVAAPASSSSSPLKQEDGHSTYPGSLPGRSPSAQGGSPKPRGSPNAQGGSSKPREEPKYPERAPDGTTEPGQDTCSRAGLVIPLRTSDLK